MTSKNYFFNLLVENMKRRIWVFILMMLGFLFTLPLSAALRIETWQARLAGGSTTFEEMLQAFLMHMISFENGGLKLLVIGGALVAGTQGFAYLFSKSQVDLYHSLPLKREKLFLANYINGVIVFIVPYLISLVICMFVGAGSGLVTMKIVMAALEAFAINLGVFLLFYNLAIGAVMMTGNLIIAIMANLVFWSYGTAISALFYTLRDMFFITSRGTYDVKLLLSPWKQSGKLWNYQYQKYDPMWHYEYGAMISEKEMALGMLKSAGILMAAIVVTFVIVMILYRIRQSESAGKAMAFAKSKAVIKIMLVVPIGIFGGLAFQSMSSKNSGGWLVFGTVLIVVLFHAFIEVVYQFDIRAVIAKKRQLLIALCAAFLVLGIFKYDIFRFDTKIPNANKVESISVAIGGLDDRIDYGIDTKVSLNEYDGTRYYYSNPVDYKIEHTAFTNVDEIYEYLIPVREYVAQMKKDKSESDATTSTITIRYNLKSGKTIMRRYPVVAKNHLPFIENIYNSEQYKKASFPVLNTDNIKEINIQTGYNGIKIDEQSKKEFLDIYRKELLTLTLDHIKEYPLAAVDSVDYNEGSDYASNTYRLGYIYPSFTETIAFLEREGRSLAPIKAEDCKQITVNFYGDLEEYFAISSADEDKTELTINHGQGTALEVGTSTTVYLETEDIEKVLAHTIPDTLWVNRNSWLTGDNEHNYYKNDLSMMVQYYDNNGNVAETRITFKTGEKEKAQFIKEDLIKGMSVDN